MKKVILLSAIMMISFPVIAERTGKFQSHQKYGKVPMCKEKSHILEYKDAMGIRNSYAIIKLINRKKCILRNFGSARFTATEYLGRQGAGILYYSGNKYQNNKFRFTHRDFFRN